METTGKLAEIDPQDLLLVERVFGQRLEAAAGGELVLRVPDAAVDKPPGDSTDLPSWCNLLKGMSDEDHDGFRATLDLPVLFTHSD